MTDDEALAPYEQLRAHRDELLETVAGDIDLHSTMLEEHSEIDDGVAEELHGLVSDAVERVVGHLWTLDGARELAQLSAVRFPDEPESSRAPTYRAGPIPPEPDDIPDPSAVQRRDPDPEQDETESDVDQDYQDELREAHDSAVFGRAMHLRQLTRHAAELASETWAVAETGDLAGTSAVLGRRDALVTALGRAFLAWEWALAGKGDGPEGPGEWELATERWLADARRRC